jgi:hypothetical protein
MFVLTPLMVYVVFGTSSTDWAQLSRLLPEDGDRIQSPKRCVLNKQHEDV